MQFLGLVMANNQRLYGFARNESIDETMVPTKVAFHSNNIIESGQRSSSEMAAKFKAPCWREIKLKFLFKFSSIFTFHVKMLYVNNVCN